MWKSSNCPVKFFRNNKLDKDVQIIVQPFNIILSVFLTSKYKIRNSYITPCEKKYPILLFFIISLFNVLNIYHIFFNESGSFFDTSIESTIFVCLETKYYLSYILLIICNIGHSHSNVSLILKIQDIHRSVDISNGLPSYLRWNWISLFTVLCSLFLRAIYFSAIKNTICFVEVSRDLLILQYNLNLVYGIRLTKLLSMYLKGWIKHIQNYRNEDNCDQFFKTYKSILETFKLYTKCFRLLVSGCLLA